MTEFQYNQRNITIEPGIEQIIGCDVNNYDGFSKVFRAALGLDFARISADTLEPIIKKMKAEHNSIDIADLCCGTGDLLEILYNRLGRNFTAFGYDRSDGQLDIADASYAHHSESAGLYFRTWDITKRYKGQAPRYLVTMTMDALNHIPKEKWPVALKNAYKTTRPGGRFYLDVNTATRYLNLTETEAIIKPHVQYFQIPTNHVIKDEWITMRMAMFGYLADGTRGAVQTEHTAPINEMEIYKMLYEAGYNKVTDITDHFRIHGSHLIAKHRLHLLCERKC